MNKISVQTDNKYTHDKNKPEVIFIVIIIKKKLQQKVQVSFLLTTKDVAENERTTGNRGFHRLCSRSFQGCFNGFMFSTETN